MFFRLTSLEKVQRLRSGDQAFKRSANNLSLVFEQLEACFCEHFFGKTSQAQVERVASGEREAIGYQFTIFIFCLKMYAVSF